MYCRKQADVRLHFYMMRRTCRGGRPRPPYRLSPKRHLRLSRPLRQIEVRPQQRRIEISHKTLQSDGKELARYLSI
jgi:hypothetical protein